MEKAVLDQDVTLRDHRREPIDLSELGVSLDNLRSSERTDFPDQVLTSSLPELLMSKAEDSHSYQSIDKININSPSASEITQSTQELTQNDNEDMDNENANDHDDEPNPCDDEDDDDEDEENNYHQHQHQHHHHHHPAKEVRFHSVHDTMSRSKSYTDNSSARRRRRRRNQSRSASEMQINQKTQRSSNVQQKNTAERPVYENATDASSVCSTCSSSSSSLDEYVYRIPARKHYGGVRVSYVPNDAIAYERKRKQNSTSDVDNKNCIIS